MPAPRSRDRRAMTGAAFSFHRGRELCAGGRIVVLTMATDDEGRFGYAPLLEALYSTLVFMAGDGFLTAEELRHMAIPTVGRTREEFAEPFADDGSVAGLALERLEICEGEDRIWEDFERTCDADKFGAQWARFLRASVFPSLATALHPAGGAARAENLFNRLEAGTATRLAAAPARMTIPLARMVLVKADATPRC
jgi:hypothetical protein